MKKIYPIEWRKTHPDQMPTATDGYYTDVANKVYDILRHSSIREYIPLPEFLTNTAIRFTSWFEDICSELGFWRIVGETCQKRYGKTLPFYDTTDYYPGEPNPQDIWLLLWDSIQSWKPERIISPDSPNIQHIANKIFEVFDKEYDYAPETDEMKSYLSNPALGNDYWATRKAIEWLSHGYYIALRGRIYYMESLAENHLDDVDDKMLYAHTLAHNFTDRHNLLSLTMAEWLSAVIRKPFTINTEYFGNRYYAVEESFPTSLHLHDMVSGRDILVEKDSFDEDWIDKHGDDKGLNLFCGIIGFNDKWYQCGAMVPLHDKAKERELQKVREQDHMKSQAMENKDLFYRASKNRPIVFLKGMKELTDFYTKRIGVKVKANTDFFRQIEKTIEEQSVDGMVALMASPDQGILIITGDIPAIKAPDNPYYDVEYARENALNFLVSPDLIDYSAASLLLEKGYLPDAALTTRYGYDHGHKLLQDNAQFILDYHFAEHM